MSDFLDQLEAALGKKILREGEAPPLSGLEPVPGFAFVYFEVADGAVPKEVFLKILRHNSPRTAKNGGASEGSCEVKTPDGQVFRSMSYSGDLDGYATDIAAGAAAHDVALAHVEDGMFVVEGGKTYHPDALEVSFAR
ncbi:MAG: hypothetical protein AAGA87_07350 [Pseudomonadota bacterium]